MLILGYNFLRTNFCNGSYNMIGFKPKILPLFHGQHQKRILPKRRTVLECICDGVDDPDFPEIKIKIGESRDKSRWFVIKPEHYLVPPAGN